MKDERKNAPVIRFDGFFDAWELRKFEDCFSFPVSTNSLSRVMLNYVTGEVKNVHYGDVLIKYPSILDIKKEEVPYITNGAFENYNSNLLKNGDLIFADAAEDETVGKAVEVNGITNENLVSGLHTIVARATKQKAEFFLGYYINSDVYHRQLLRLMQGSKVSAISKGNLQKTDMSFPRDIEEQKKIGVFFKQLDDTITLHQCKIDALKRMKKGLLQQMFPTNEESVPRVRFADFENEWRQCKLGYFSKTTFGGGTPKTSVSEYWNGEIPWIQSSNLTVDDVQNVRLDKFITEEGIKNSATKLVPANSIAIVTRVGVGKLALMKQAFTTSQDFLSLSDLDVDEQFGLYSVYELLQKELNNIQGTSIKGMTKADLLTKKIMTPVDKDEQAEIGAFFKNLDSLIALHQDQLNKLKTVKKAYLQNMFI